MSDLNEQYQEQVLVDLSDIKESVTTDSGYQEKVLDDLHDIKESVSEEQDYYDKEYQKKVLGNLRTLQKSVEALNVNYVEVSPSNVIEACNHLFYKSGNVYQVYVNGNYKYYTCDFDVSDLDLVYLSSNSSSYTCCFFKYNDSLNYLMSLSHNSYYNPSDYTIFNSNLDKLEIDVESFSHLIVQVRQNDFDPEFTLFKLSDQNEDVVSGSAVIADGIDTLIQITTFQGFASALLTGILLFLVFVKGLRR